MMDLVLATSGGEAQAAGGGYVDDVFSAYTYTGNGTSQTINNGIDLAGNGGLVWIKKRTNTFDTNNTNHWLFDSSRGNGISLSTNSVSASSNVFSGLLPFNSNGFGVNASDVNLNGSDNYISWTFRKAPKFFDVVTYTGNGASNRALSHQLNADVGMVMVKATSATGDWWVFHRSATGDLVLNTNAAQTASKANIPSATSSTFTVNGSANTNGVQYVAYLFAHDPSAEGTIQCGSYVASTSPVTVTLGWEPQFILIKRVTNGSSATGWYLFDVTRGMAVDSAGTGAPYLRAEAADAEIHAGAIYTPRPTATGFVVPSGSNGTNGTTSSDTYIYLAIRRSNKPPTSGTQVYNAIARTGTGATATVTGVGFAPDFMLSKARYRNEVNALYDRLRGVSVNLNTMTASSEIPDITEIISFDPQGVTIGNNSSTNYRTNRSGWDYINHFFRRAKGFFDVVCDTGTGASHAIAHNLTKAPELIIRKSRSAATQWEVWHSALAATEKMVLNSTAAKVTDATAWNSALPTATQFTVGTGANVNANTATFVTYLFATLAGISKVGSYTGNETSQTINCGFATGARFILIKRTDVAGDWYVWDSVRGIIAANDPHLSLNTTAAEVTTDDSVDPEASGFIVNQNTATNINVSGGQYIFLAIA